MYVAGQAATPIHQKPLERKKFVAAVPKEYPYHMGSFFTKGEMIVKEIAYTNLMNCSSELKKR
jgi:hypothetical protein